MNKEKKKMMVPKLRFAEFRDAGEWEEKPLGEVAEIITGSTPSTTEASNYGGDQMFVSPADIGEGRYINQTKTKITDTGYSQTRKIKKNSVLFVCIGSTIGKIAQNNHECATNQQINSVVPYEGYLSDFIYSSLENDSSKIASLAGKHAVPIINKTVFSSVQLKLPPTENEQQKIANCFSSLDDLITAQSQKIKALQTHKKGLMQQLFPAEGEMVPRVRFREFEDSGEWEIRQLDEFIIERSQFPTEKVPLYSLTIENGVTPKTERYERSFLVRDEEEAYKLVYPNDFAYNPMNLRFGAIAKYSGDSKVALSKYYNIFYCDDSVDSQFCELYFTSYGMITHYNNVATGSLIEKRRVHFSDFMKFKIYFPKLPEQQKISAVLNSLNELINAQTQKLEALKAQKKGLMQQLFPNINQNY